jgi:peroxiredoxin Q/BCP
LRQDYEGFTSRNTEIIVLGPDGPNAFKRYWEEEKLPFIGCADIRSVIASRYQQEVNWFKLGRMPALFVINKEGKIVYQQYGTSMADIPPNDEVFRVLDGLK